MIVNIENDFVSVKYNGLWYSRLMDKSMDHLDTYIEYHLINLLWFIKQEQK